jgi:hypothetical protein
MEFQGIDPLLPGEEVNPNGPQWIQSRQIENHEDAGAQRDNSGPQSCAHRFRHSV